MGWEEMKQEAFRLCDERDGHITIQVPNVVEWNDKSIIPDDMRCEVELIVDDDSVVLRVTDIQHVH